MKLPVSVLFGLAFAAVAFAAMPTATSPTGEPEIITRVAAPGQVLADIVSPADYVKTDVDPGVAPEGDYLDRTIFTPDGARAIISNRMTGNITVFDWATMAVETTLDVGSYPSGMAVTDSLLVITRPFADSVTIVRLADWSVAARLPSGEQPWEVRISPDGSRAYVGCDISNTCEVYDLETLTRVATLADFPCYLVTVSWNSENGRFYGDFNKFEVAPDGDHLIVPDTGNFIYWIDVTSGAKVDTIAGVGRCWFVRYSGDSTKLVTANYATPCVAWQLDVATRTRSDSVTVTGYSLSTVDAAVNQDGTKAFLGTGSNTSTIVNFTTGGFTNFTQTYTAFWIGVSPDHSLAISGQYRFSIIDFDSETLLGQHQGNSQSFGAISPVGFRAVGFDPHRHEGLYFYDYTNPTPVYRGTTNSGGEPEGDAPHRVAVSPDGSRVIASSVLSDNFTVIDGPAAMVDTILPLGDRPQDIAFTSDSRWAVVTGLNGNNIAVVDLADNSMTQVAVGTGPATVVITPNDSFACVGNISSNNVSVVRLDGAASQVVATIPCGEIGIVWGSYGVWSGLGMSPDGRHCLVAVSFEDAVRVIDTQTWTVVDTLTVGDFPLCFAFDSTGEYATVSNYMAGSYSVLKLDGANSAVVGTFNSGQYAMRVAYNPALDQVGIGNYGARTLTLANPRTGAVINTISYTAYGALADVGFDLEGNPVVLTASSGDILGMVHRGSDHVELPAVPCAFAWNPATELCAVACPGPDYVPLIKWSTSGAHEVNYPAPRAARPALSVPAVTRGIARLGLTLFAPGPARVETYSAAGRRVATIYDGRLPAGTHTLEWNTEGLPAGSYLVRLAAGGVTVTRPLAVVR